MINLQNISKYYKTQQPPITALDDISLTVQKGEIYGIIGKSGAGKSTMIRCINLLEKPSRGEVYINNQNIMMLPPKDLRAVRRQIGMIFQHFNLLSTRTVYENIALPLTLAGTPRAKFDDIILPLLEFTGLTDKKNQYPAQLSGGQKQRVAIARALAPKPSILLCDEATSALDPETTSSILSLLKNIRDQMGLAILLITHEMSVIKACCDRVGILENGKLIEENKVGEFFAYPQTDIAKQFISNAMSQALPSAILERLEQHPRQDTHPLIKLKFLPNTANLPIIAKLIQDFNLRVNILQGNVEYIKQHAMGIMLVAIDGQDENLTQALTFLKNTGIHTEIIGHVPNDIISFA